MPGIRNKVDIQQSLQNSAKAGSTPKVDKKTDEQLKKFRRDNTAMPDYYKAWEKMAANIDDDSSEEENIAMEEQKQFEPMFDDLKKEME